MPLRILCFGNSLTAGFRSYGIEPDHPYAITLREQLLSAELDASLLGGDGRVDIDVEGQPGDLVNCPPGSFLERMKRRCMFFPPPFPWNRIDTYANKESIVS
jgi:hypothetical protein